MTSEEIVAYTKEYDALTLQSRTFERIAVTFDLPNKRVLDIGCGVGSHMQRFAENSVGITANHEEVEVGKVFNRDIRFGNAEFLSETLPVSEKFDAIWCNNIFEHLLSPHSFLVKLKLYAHADTILIIGTPMVPTPAALMKLKKFRGALANAHINFFTKKTYQLTAQYAGWSTKQLRPFFSSSDLIDRVIAPCTPHLYLVAQNDTSYRYSKKKMREWRDDERFSDLINIMSGAES